jgi:hypothetical protein
MMILFCPERYMPPMPMAVISLTLTVGMPKRSPSILVDPAPVIMIRSISGILSPFSMIILPNAPVAEVTASCALVFIFFKTVPPSMEIAFVIVLPMSIPIIIISIDLLSRKGELVLVYCFLLPPAQVPPSIPGRVWIVLTGSEPLI